MGNWYGQQVSFVEKAALIGATVNPVRMGENMERLHWRLFKLAILGF